MAAVLATPLTWRLVAIALAVCSFAARPGNAAAPMLSGGYQATRALPHAEYDVTITTHGDADGALMVDRTGFLLLRGSAFDVTAPCGHHTDLIVSVSAEQARIAPDGSFARTERWRDQGANWATHVEGRFLTSRLVRGRLWARVGGGTTKASCGVAKSRQIHFQARYSRQWTSP